MHKGGDSLGAASISRIDLPQASREIASERSENERKDGLLLYMCKTEKWFSFCYFA
jgi:hypothetical protein